MNFTRVLIVGSSSYVRWGRTTCPSTCENTLVYSGRVGGPVIIIREELLTSSNDPEYLYLDLEGIKLECVCCCFSDYIEHTHYALSTIGLSIIPCLNNC